MGVPSVCCARDSTDLGMSMSNRITHASLCRLIIWLNAKHSGGRALVLGIQAAEH